MRKSIIALGLLAATGCAKYQAPVKFSKNPGQPTKPGPYQDVEFKRPACEVVHFDYILDSEFLAFEFKDQNKVSFGFAENTILKNIGLDLSLDIKRSELSSKMTATTFLSPEMQPMFTTSQVKASEFGFKGKIDFSKVGLGYEHYSSTSLSKLSLKGLERTFGELSKEMLTKENHSEPWFTRVLELPPSSTDVDSPGHSVIIQAGYTAGVQVDDEFTVTNTVHRWADDKPCVGRHYSEVPKGDGVSVRVRVVYVDAYTSEAVIVPDGVTNEKIEQGAKVVIAQLKSIDNKKRSTLGRSVWIRSVKSKPLVIAEKPVDLKPYAKEQIRDVISLQTTKGRYYVADPE
ncbi:MAG TPA: hypothetical protein VM432_10495 [Bdellovibrionales bacterium]|nr:hypothetical protein [Bdellovibrionales bacterium]